MNIKRILSLAIVFGMAFLIAGCNSNVSETVNEKENDNAKKYEKVFKETDVVAHDFMVVKIEQNYPEVLKYMSPKGIEELKEKSGNLLDAHRLPNEFEELDGEYELRRYDNFYDEENGEVIYRYSRHNDRGVIVNDWIILKQNEERDWKVRSYYDVRPDMINESNSETGTVLHELPAEDKGK
ncbi:hypothetical protein JSQ81_07725 [Sporosarcina sp. Marseille-Q4063]|uniref:hypothetical protein n=1 Tax=Sporosarcina sp. Marseille-Q4063 TaxID=2810514 RepID=UPI001BB0D1BB|nr:hypothetical protein [Sporosarcina sp. Marseille-Q4063]QUW23402.1 hypothetical protein JSQ81_07725 [Sporosarcina sp. Marseille-Q4063]